MLLALYCGQVTQHIVGVGCWYAVQSLLVRSIIIRWQAARIAWALAYSAVLPLSHATLGPAVPDCSTSHNCCLDMQAPGKRVV
jgi:hypothetical protein